MPRRQDLATSGLDALPLPAMLSAALVAFVIECDGEIEVELGGAGRGPTPSLVVWLNLMQYLREGPVSVAELSARSHTSIDHVRFLVGKLEHWGVLSVAAASAAPRSVEQARARQDVGNVRASSLVGVGETALPAVELWPAVLDEVESRWQRRHGPALAAALKAAAALADRAGVLMPAVVPVASGNRAGRPAWKDLPAGKLQEPTQGRVAVTLSRALMATKIAYEGLSPLPLVVAANTLRVIEDEGTPVTEIPARCGNPPETVASQCTLLTKGLGFAELVKDPYRRGRVLRLTGAGKDAQAMHARAIGEVEASVDPSGTTARALRRLLAARHDGALALRAALTPPPGTRRFSTEWVSGRPIDTRDHQVVAQAEAFRADPFRALPHYPVWEATRGFRP